MERSVDRSIVMRPEQAKEGIIQALYREGACAAGVAPFYENGYRSCVVALFSYSHSSERGCGTIAKYARGQDYHLVVKERLENAVSKAYPAQDGIRATAAVDISPLDERELAIRAGLGFRGRNGLLIHPVYGSFVLIGTICINLPLPEDRPLQERCFGCERCVEACPGGALGNQEFNPERCLSNISQTKKITPQQEALFKKGVYTWGCDVCQDVCPHNRSVPDTKIEAFTADLIRDLDGIEAEQFQTKYKNRAFSWRGFAILERNRRIFSEKAGKNNG